MTGAIFTIDDAQLLTGPQLPSIFALFMQFDAKLSEVRQWMTGTINPHSANERKCGRLGCHSDMSAGDLIGRQFSVNIYNILIFQIVRGDS